MNMFNEIFRSVGQWATTVLRIVVIIAGYSASTI